jgi:hypothetical protein
MPFGQQFLDAGWGLKGGLPYRPWAAELVKARMAENGKDDPTSHCLPGGVLKMHTTPLLRKIVQTPGLIVILNEHNAEYRQIFTDGRPLPEDPQPSWNGYSSGKWDGDTLVVQTNGFRDGLWLDRNGSPMTDAARMTERFRRVNYGKLEIEVTVDDPKAYHTRWTIKLNQFIVLNTELLDFVCLENEKDMPHLVGKQEADAEGKLDRHILWRGASLGHECNRCRLAFRKWSVRFRQACVRWFRGAAGGDRMPRAISPRIVKQKTSWALMGGLQRVPWGVSKTMALQSSG